MGNAFSVLASSASGMGLLLTEMRQTVTGEGKVTSWDLHKSLGGPPSEGLWLHAGKNSREKRK